MGERAMEVKLVVSDIDGTLLRQEHALSPALKEEIWRLDRRGIPFTFATGRLPFETDGLLEGLPPQRVPYVGGNGSILKLGDTLLEDRRFFPRRLKAVAEAYAALGVTVIFNDGNLERPLRSTPWSRAHAGVFPGLDSPVGPEVWSRETRRMYFYHPEGTHLADCLEDLCPFAGEYAVCLQDDRSIQISAAGCTKAQGVQTLARRCGIPREHILCIGDSYNDTSMLQYAGIGAAVGNACTALKEAADYVSPLPCWEGAVQIMQTLIP